MNTKFVDLIGNITVANGFIYKNVKVKVTPNGEYFTAMGQGQKDGQFFAAFDKTEDIVIAKISTKIDEHYN